MSQLINKRAVSSTPVPRTYLKKVVIYVLSARTRLLKSIVEIRPLGWRDVEWRLWGPEGRPTGHEARDWHLVPYWRRSEKAGSEFISAHSDRRVQRRVRKHADEKILNQSSDIQRINLRCLTSRWCLCQKGRLKYVFKLYSVCLLESVYLRPVTADNGSKILSIHSLLSFSF